MCNFYVGQRVRGVDAEPSCGDMHGLTEGETYTIRWIGPTPELIATFYPEEGATIDVRLNEIDRSIGVWRGENEATFRATRFRPLTDISSLERLLRAEPIGETVDA